jgi:acetyl-CoA carboxylase biotin carboxyl carrier protein
MNREMRFVAFLNKVGTESMSSDKPDGDQENDADVFDLERVRQLIALMKEHELSEIDLRHASKRIKLRSGHEPTWVSHSAGPGMMAAATRSDGGPAAPVEEENVAFIKSPMVGTFYTSAKPGEPTFIKIGDHVQADTIVCIVEAMKMFNEIPAGIAGKVIGLVAKNEEPVDVGRPLFKIIPD